MLLRSPWSSSVALLAFSAVVWPQPVLQGTVCDPVWQPEFGGHPGVTGSFGPNVVGLASYDDGAGTDLYLAGTFDSASTVDANNVVRWDGTSFSAVGNGLASSCRDLIVHDDGSGPCLFAAALASASSDEVAKWDGLAWSTVGSGIDGWVNDLEVFDDGSGPALYAAGNFDVAGGVPAQNIAKWDGIAWSGLGTGVDGTLSALTVYDDGTGPALYAGGQFSNAGAATSLNIAKWDGATWSNVGTGTDGLVVGLAVFDEGNGPVLIAGGSFSNAGGQPAQNVARWDGSAWSAVGPGVVANVRSVGVGNDGSGASLYVGASGTSVGVLEWDGTSWNSLPSPPDGAALVFHDHPTTVGSELFIGGLFASVSGTLHLNHIGRLDTAGWSSLGGGIGDDVRCLLAHDDGSGETLYAGGMFESADGVSLGRIGRWDGMDWSALGSGMSGDVLALEVFNEGLGPKLFAAGAFSQAGGVPANKVARWNGSVWSPVGTGFGSVQKVNALEVFDDGAGVKLYSGSSNGVQAWDGVSWTTIALGPTVFALHAYDDGSGEALYVAGQFSSIGGSNALNIAKYDGTTFAPLGSGIGGLQDWVRALEVHDDGSGPALYAGGKFNHIGALQTFTIGRWDGSDWSAVGFGANNFVRALHSHDDGSGPALYAGGAFLGFGSVFANRVGRWDGVAWEPMQNGTNGEVWTLGSFDEGLFAGGSFTRALDSGDSFLARWERTCDGPIAYCQPKPSSVGCQASISSSSPAVQPVSGAGDYSVVASDVHAFRTGLVFAGLSGQTALPFLGGTLCVMPPIKKRGPITFSNGSAPDTCTGSFATLVNDGAVIPGGLDGGPGGSVWYQWWYRDPPNGAGSLGIALSDAVRLDFH